MANAYEVLGQTTDSASGTALVTCPASTEAIVKSLIICNLMEQTLLKNI